jgi:predicted enzyme related to lactoylglutathione lyase
MGTRATRAPGTFSWVDLATTDATAAKSFYGGLFGWEMRDGDSGGGAVHTTCHLDGDAVCGLVEMPDDDARHGRAAELDELRHRRRRGRRRSARQGA